MTSGTEPDDDRVVQRRLFRPPRGLSRRTRRLGLRQIRRIRRQLDDDAPAEGSGPEGADRD